MRDRNEAARLQHVHVAISSWLQNLLKREMQQHATSSSAYRGRCNVDAAGLLYSVDNAHMRHSHNNGNDATLESTALQWSHTASSSEKFPPVRSLGVMPASCFTRIFKETEALGTNSNE